MSLPKNSVHLVVTSPPYPMIQMWDDCFDTWAKNNNIIFKDLLVSNNTAQNAFENVHLCLDLVWQSCDDALIDGGFVCINIGDAVRTIDSNFQLFSNHTRITNWFLAHNYVALPPIIWHKPTNSPNKFMGSGMYPCGAYVTYEHEYILIFKKQGKRGYTKEEQQLRKESAYFYEERNRWFSDLWDIKGTSQKLWNGQSSRNRNASFPFEIPYRLINMYSIQGDVILDPFVGLGTTSFASLSSNRNSIGFDVDAKILKTAKRNLLNCTIKANTVATMRLERHRLAEEELDCTYFNDIHNFKVKTKQEVNLHIRKPFKVYSRNDLVVCEYQE